MWVAAAALSHGRKEQVSPSWDPAVPFNLRLAGWQGGSAELGTLVWANMCINN